MTRRSTYGLALLPLLVGLLAACSKDAPPSLDTNNKPSGGGGGDLAPCSKAEEGTRRACGEVKSKVGNQVTCMKGTQICAAGLWQPCVASPDTVATKTVAPGTLRPMALGGPGRCANACDPYCNTIVDVIDLSVEPGEGGAAIVCPDAGEDADDAGKCGITIGTGLDPNVGGDASPIDLDILSDGGNIPDGSRLIFHILNPGDVAAPDNLVFIDAKIRTADMYFMIDQTSSMYDEAEALASALSDQSANGIISGIKTALGPLVNFGFGRFEEYPVFPYGFTGEDNKAFEHVLSMQADVGPAQRAALWARDDAFPLQSYVDPGTGQTFTYRSSQHPGGDLPESHVAALWSAVSGRGLYRSGPTTPTFGSTVFWTPPRDFWLGSPILPVTDAYGPDQPTGSPIPCPTVQNPPTGYLAAYPCWRPNSTPIFVVITDAPPHNGPGGWYAYNHLPAFNGAVTSAIPGATLLSSLTTPVQMPRTGDPTGYGFAEAITLPAGASGPAAGVYYGTVPARDSRSGITGGVYTIPATTGPTTPPLQVPQRASLRDCRSGGNTTCNPITQTVTQDVPLQTQPINLQTFDTRTDPTPPDTRTQTSLSNPTAPYGDTSGLQNGGALDSQPRYVNPVPAATSVSAIGSQTAKAQDYSSLNNPGALAAQQSMLSTGGTAAASGTYSSLNQPSYQAPTASQDALQFVSSLSPAETRTSLSNPGTTRPADQTQLSAGAAPSTPTSALDTTTNLPSTNPGAQAAQRLVSTTNGGNPLPYGATVNATPGTTVATVAAQTSLDNSTYLPFFATATAAYGSPTPVPTEVTALSGGLALNPGGGTADTYSGGIALSGVSGSRVTGSPSHAPYTSTLDVYPNGTRHALLGPVTSLGGTYAAFNDTVPFDVYYGGIVPAGSAPLYAGLTPATATVTALPTATFSVLPSNPQDAYASGTDPNVAFLALENDGTAQNTTVSIPARAVDTGNASALRSFEASGQTCSITGGSVSSNQAATYTSIASGFVSGWGPSGQPISGAPGAGMVQIANYAVPAYGRFVASVSIISNIQGGQVSIYVRKGAQPTTTTFDQKVIASQDEPNGTITLYSDGTAGTYYIGVTKDVGSATAPYLQPTVTIEYARASVDSCASGANFLYQGSSSAARCVACASGNTWDSVNNCCTAPNQTCPSGKTYDATGDGTNGAGCYIIDCAAYPGWTLSGTRCIQPACTTSENQVGSFCYSKTYCAGLTGYTANANLTQCDPNSPCNGAKVAFSGQCFTPKSCPPATPNTAGSTWSLNTSTQMCSPNNSCGSKTGPYDKGTGSKCWTVSSCSVFNGTSPPTNYRAGDGSPSRPLTHMCYQDACPTSPAGLTAITGNAYAADGCYDLSAANTSCSGTAFRAGVRYTYSSSTYSCAPANTNANGCISSALASGQTVASGRRVTAFPVRTASATATTTSFPQPAVGSTASVSVGSASGLSIGQTVEVARAGYYRISNIAGTTLTLQTLSTTFNQATTGSTVASGRALYTFATSVPSTTTTASFNQPTAGNNVSVTVANGALFTAGSPVLVDGSGYYVVASVAGNTLSLTNPSTAITEVFADKGSGSACYYNAAAVCTSPGSVSTLGGTSACQYPLCASGLVVAQNTPSATSTTAAAPSGDGCYQYDNTSCNYAATVSASGNPNINQTERSTAGYSHSPANFTCLPTNNAGCESGWVKFSKTAPTSDSGVSWCYSPIACQTTGTTPTAGTPGSGATANVCTLPNCDTGETCVGSAASGCTGGVAPSPTPAGGNGCYPNSQIDTNCNRFGGAGSNSSLNAYVTYTAGGTSGAFTCVPSGCASAGPNGYTQVLFDKTNNSTASTSANATCWEDTGCTGTRGSPQTYLCTTSTCPSGYTPVSGNPYASDGCYPTSIVTNAAGTNCSNVTISNVKVAQALEPTGYTTTLATTNQPYWNAPGARSTRTNVYVNSSTPFSVGSTVFMPNAGFYVITNKPSGGLLLDINNLGFRSQPTSGTVQSMQGIFVAATSAASGLTVTSFTHPSTGSAGSMTSTYGSSLSPGQTVYILGHGYDQVLALTGTTTARLRNIGAESASSNSTVSSGTAYYTSSITPVTTTSTTAAFTQPAVDGTVPVSVGSTTPFSPGQRISIRTGGTYQVSTVDSSTQLTLVNLGSSGNATAGTNIATAQIVAGTPSATSALATTTTATFSQPAVSSSVTVTVNSTAGFALGQSVSIVGGGYYTVAGVTSGTQLSLTNVGSFANSSVGTNVPAGAAVRRYSSTGIFTTTTGAFTTPTAGSTQNVNVTSSAGLVVSQEVLIGQNTFVISAIPSTTRITIQQHNPIPVGNSSSGTSITTGTTVMVPPSSEVATTTSANFTQPSSGSQVAVSVAGTYGIFPNQTVEIDGGGVYKVVAITSATQLQLQNISGAATNAASGTLIASGVNVTLRPLAVMQRFTQPSSSSGNVSVNVGSSFGHYLNEVVYVPGGGYYNVNGVVDGSTLTLQNNTPTAQGNLASASVVPAGTNLAVQASSNAFLSSFFPTAAGGNAVVTVASTAAYSTGQELYLADAGYYAVASVLDATHLLLTNTGSQSNNSSLVKAFGPILVGTNWAARVASADTMPAIDATEDITLDSTTGMSAGEPVYIQGIGDFTVDTVVSGTVVRLRNVGTGNNVTAGTAIPANRNVFRGLPTTITTGSATAASLGVTFTYRSSDYACVPSSTSCAGSLVQSGLGTSTLTCFTNNGCGQLANAATTVASGNTVALNSGSIYTTTSAAFVQPAVGASVTVAVTAGDGTNFPAGQNVYVAGGGFYSVSASGANSLTLTNLGLTGNADAGAAIASATTTLATRTTRVGTGGFTNPTVGNNVTIPVTSSSIFRTGDAVYVASGGSYLVASIPSGTSLTLQYLGNGALSVETNQPWLCMPAANTCAPSLEGGRVVVRDGASANPPGCYLYNLTCTPSGRPTLTTLSSGSYTNSGPAGTTAYQCVPPANSCPNNSPLYDPVTNTCAQTYTCPGTSSGSPYQVIATTSTADFAQPAINANVAVTVASTANFISGRQVRINGSGGTVYGGLYTIMSIDSATQLTLRNDGTTTNGNASAGQTIASGSTIRMATATTVSLAFFQPSVGSNVDVSVASASQFSVGQTVVVGPITPISSNIGTYNLVAITGSTLTLTLTNAGAAGGAGTLVALGTAVSAGSYVCTGLTCPSGTYHNGANADSTGATNQCKYSSCPPANAASYPDFDWNAPSPGSSSATATCTPVLDCTNVAGRVAYDAQDGNGTRCWSILSCPSGASAGPETAYQCQPTTCGSGQQLLPLQTRSASGSSASNGMVGWWRGGDTSGYDSGNPSAFNPYLDALGNSAIGQTERRSGATPVSVRVVPSPFGAGASYYFGSNRDSAVLLDSTATSTTTTASFTQPSVNSTQTVNVSSSAAFTVGQTIYVGDGGIYTLTAKPSGTRMTLRNEGYAQNKSPTLSIASGAAVVAVTSPLAFTGSFSVTATIRPEVTASTAPNMMRIIDRITTTGSGSTLGTDGWALELTSNNRLQARLGSTTCLSSYQIPNGTSVVVSMTYTQATTNSTVNLYVYDTLGNAMTGGAATCTVATASAGPRVVAGRTRIGSDSGNYNGFQGWIDEIAVFSQVLPQATVQSLSTMTASSNGVSGLYGQAQCYSLSCPATSSEWQWTGTGTFGGSAGSPAYVCQASNACSGSRIAVDKQDGNGSRCWDDGCPAAPPSWTHTQSDGSAAYPVGTSYTCSTGVWCPSGDVVQGVPGVTDGCYNRNTGCTGLSSTYTWSYNASTGKCDPGNNGCPASGGYVYATYPSSTTGCYVNDGCNADVATGGDAGTNYTCTRRPCSISSGQVYSASDGLCHDVLACPTATVAAQYPGVTWSPNLTNYTCSPGADLCGTGLTPGVPRVRYTVNSNDLCWDNPGCGQTNGTTDPGGTLATGYMCTPPACAIGSVLFNGNCYVDLGCPPSGTTTPTGVTWSRNTGTQTCNPVNGPCGSLTSLNGQCYEDVGCAGYGSSYVYDANPAPLGVCRGCTGARVQSGGQCWDYTCPADSPAANGVKWTPLGGPGYMCRPNQPCDADLGKVYASLGGGANQCWDEGCPASWTINTTAHECAAPRCPGKTEVSGTCYTIVGCPSPDWTPPASGQYVCTVASCTASSGVTPCTDPAFSCTGPDGSAQCVRVPSCAVDCPPTADRVCTIPSPSLGGNSLRCETTSQVGCTGTTQVGDGGLAQEIVYKFTVPTGLPLNRYYYHFALLRTDGSGHQSDANAFLYIKPASGVDAASSANQNGNVLDCNRDANAFYVFGTSDERRRHVRSEINSYLAPGDYYLVVDHKATSQLSTAYDYVLQVGSFDDPDPPAAPSYNQMIGALQQLQAKIIGVDTSGVSCQQAGNVETNIAQYDTRDFLEKLAYDTGSIDTTDLSNPKPFVVSIRNDATDCDATSGTLNGLSQQLVLAAQALGNTLRQDLRVRPQLPNVPIGPNFQPPVGVDQFIQSVSGISTTVTQDYCGDPSTNLPDISADTLAQYQKFNLCRPGVTANFNVVFQIPPSIPPVTFDRYFRFDLVILAGTGEVGRYPVVLKVPGTTQPADYVRKYQLGNLCAVGEKARFGSFLWGTTTPPGYSGSTPSAFSSSVQFYLRTGATEADLDNPANPETLIGSAKASPLPDSQVGSTDLGPLNIDDRRTPYLRVRARLNPSLGGDKPIITDWQLVYSCPPSE